MSRHTSHSGDLDKIAGRLCADDVTAGELVALNGLIAELRYRDAASELAAFMETVTEHLRANRDVTWCAVYSARNVPEDHPAYASLQRVRETMRPVHE